MQQNPDLITKMGGVAALLVGTLAISNPATALNTIIGNTISNQGFRNPVPNVGQSFANDPSGTGATINLNTWTFDFSGSQTTAAASTLVIYNGTGNGGSVVGTSSITSTAAVTGFPTSVVTWTFAGGLQIIDISTYTAAVLNQSLFYSISSLNPYPNGTRTQGANPVTGSDLVFQGTFSAATPVPFEFSPALGSVGLGALWLAKKKLVSKTK